MILLRGTARRVLAALVLSAGAAAPLEANDPAHRPIAPAIQRLTWDGIESELLPASGHSAIADTARTTDEAARPQTELNRPLQNRDREKQPVQRGASSATPGGWPRTALSLFAVIGLVLLLAWGYRNVAMGSTPLTPRGRGGGVIQIVGRQSISPRHALCLVRVGPRLVLVGQTQDRLTQLDVIHDAALVSQLVGESGTAAGRSDAAQFQQQLVREAVEYERQAAPDGASSVHGALRRMQSALKHAIGK